MKEQRELAIEDAPNGAVESDEPAERDVRDEPRALEVMPSSRPGLRMREEFGISESEETAEAASTALAAMARATVEARYVMALKRPRDMDDVRQRILKDCQRPSFAEVARYRKPIGKGVEGLSIRFVEAALRHMGNVLVQSPAISDTPKKRTVRVSVTDLETNTCFEKDIFIEKTVERSQAPEGEFISARKNKKGRNVYLVAATEDDLLNKEGSLVSKAIRNNGLRVIPGDFQAEAELMIQKTLRDRAAKDPDAERHALTDAFASLSIQPSDLKSYLGHDLGPTTPQELTDLRALYVALKEGETTWRAVLEARGQMTAEDAPGQSKTEKLKEKLGKKTEATA